jgi:hypothetical protein
MNVSHIVNNWIYILYKDSYVNIVLETPERIDSWRWRQYDLSKRRDLLAQRHSVTPQNSGVAVVW